VHFYHGMWHVVLVLIHADLERIVVLLTDLSFVSGAHRPQVAWVVWQVIVLAELEL
jgi:hypothetical protein